MRYSSTSASTALSTSAIAWVIKIPLYPKSAEKIRSTTRKTTPCLLIDSKKEGMILPVA